MRIGTSQKEMRALGLAKLVGNRFLLGIALIASLAVAQDKPKEIEPLDPQPAAQPAATPSLEAAAPVDPNGYKLGPEDVIGIRVWREADLSGNFVVRPDGKITLPLVGDISVLNKTLSEVKGQVIEGYTKFVNKPEITVSLARVGSKKYYLVGEVNRAGAFPLVVPTTILEALNMAGGLREFANKKKINILRDGQVLKFNYADVMKGKNMSQNIYLQNGDHVIVR